MQATRLGRSRIPFHTLEVLAPLALTTGIRDSRIWIEDDQVHVMWVPLGQGNIGIDRWTARFRELRPDLAFSLEMINLRSARKFAVRDAKFWEDYRDVPAWVYEGFMKLARNGQPYVAPEGEPVALERQEVAADLPTAVDCWDWYSCRQRNLRIAFGRCPTYDDAR